MKYRGIIFDLDGVICSTDEYHYLAWKALADRLDIPFDRERNNLLRGVSRMQSLEIILEKSDKTYTDEEKAVFAEEKNTTYRQQPGRMSPADLSEDVKNHPGSAAENRLEACDWFIQQKHALHPGTDRPERLL